MADIYSQYSDTAQVNVPGGGEGDAWPYGPVNAKYIDAQVCVQCDGMTLGSLGWDAVVWDYSLDINFHQFATVIETFPINVQNDSENAQYVFSFVPDQHNVTYFVRGRAKREG